MGIRIFRFHGWQKPCRGSRWTMRMATPGTRTGSSSFFQICMWYMFICKFFNGNMALVPLVTPEIRIPIRKLVNKLVSHAYLKKWTTPCPGPWVAVLIVHLEPRYGLCHPCDLEILITIEKLAYEHVSHAYSKNQQLPGTLIWPLTPLQPKNSDSHKKIAYERTCITYIFEKNELLPVLVPGVAVLVVHLDPQYDLCHPWNP
jgi:hypothetical protein